PTRAPVAARRHGAPGALARRTGVGGGSGARGGARPPPRSGTGPLCRELGGATRSCLLDPRARLGGRGPPPDHGRPPRATDGPPGASRARLALRTRELRRASPRAHGPAYGARARAARDLRGFSRGGSRGPGAVASGAVARAALGAPQLSSDDRAARSLARRSHDRRRPPRGDDPTGARSPPAHRGAPPDAAAGARARRAGRGRRRGGASLPRAAAHPGVRRINKS